MWALFQCLLSSQKERNSDTDAQEDSHGGKGKKWRFVGTTKNGQGLLVTSTGWEGTGPDSLNPQTDGCCLSLAFRALRECVCVLCVNVRVCVYMCVCCFKQYFVLICYGTLET